MRNLRFARAVSLVLCVVMCDAGLAGTLSASPGSPKAAQLSSYDGETLFRGLFFGTGPVADLFPEIWQDPNVFPYVEKMRTSPDNAALIDRITGRITAGNPGFFPSFAAEIQSGDHLRVEEAMKSAASRLAQAAQEETGLDATSGPSPGRRESDTNVDTYVYLAYVVALALVFVFAAFVWFPQLPQNGSGLQHDVLVEMVATRLAHPTAQ